METTETREATAIFSRYLYRRYGGRSTAKHYLSDLAIFLRYLEGKALRQVTAQDIDGFIDAQRGLSMAATTINRRLATLHTFFECLAAQVPDEVWPNPVHWRRHRVKQGYPIARDASDLEVERLFGVIDQARDAAMFGLMVGAGLRVGEVAQLRLSDLSAPRATDQLTQLRVRGKGERERMVWITPLWYAKVASWLVIRPASEDDRLFLNQHGRGLTKDGIQYWLKRYTATAGITITCHQLRHTFARRLADQRMPIESISKLLGHAFVTTTQRYTLGANPDLRAAFQVAMTQIEGAPPAREPELPFIEGLRPPRQSAPADSARLTRELERFDGFPDWLRDELYAYAQQRWHSWKPHMASRYITRLTSQQFNAWTWLLEHGQLHNWEDVHRRDLERWLDARGSAGLSLESQYTELCDLRAFLKYVVDRGQAVDPNIFRIPVPSLADPLPKHLSDAEFTQLVKTVFAQTAEETLAAVAARAWFLTLAHTGMRLNELLDLRVAEVDFAAGRILICNPKGGHDRMAFMTPTLAHYLRRYLAQRPATADDHLWFYSNRLLSDETVRDQLGRWGQQCGVKVTPHQLRHTFATQLINHGLPMESIRMLLGHKTLTMTQHYARMYDATVKRQFESAAAAIEGICINDWPIPAIADPSAPSSPRRIDSV